MTRSALAERRFKRQVQRLKRAVDSKSCVDPMKYRCESMQDLHWPVKDESRLRLSKARSEYRSADANIAKVGGSDEPVFA
ncbi:hypothetical protein M6B38_384380 [Iris pallida]|uniref:Uncharacterized protein n=1 Tax=Iris pallida TaxID=29817 RepID=A0AAX6G3T8_IRIPA|nr:hypothetical protein M6B38_384380 [Iris pallida]